MSEHESKPGRRRRRSGAGMTIGGILAGLDQQIMRSTPPADELVAKGKRNQPVAASDGGTLSVDLPGDPGPTEPERASSAPRRLTLEAPGIVAVVDLDGGGRIASFRVDDRELLRTEGDGPIQWGSFPMAPYAGRVRDARFEFEGRSYSLPVALPPHAIHGTVLDRAWSSTGDGVIETELGPDWPFAGRAIQRFGLTPDRLEMRLEVHADERMPASIGWHPWFLRRPEGVAGELELELDAGSTYVRDASGIATGERVPPPAGPWDDCFTDLRRPPVLRWPGFLELTIESDGPDWVVYTEPKDAVCIEPQTAPPDALNQHPAIVEPGRPLVATMIWRWRRLAAG